MSRSRLVSTELSNDSRVATMVAKHGVLPLVVYQSAIAHADDWGRLRGNATEFTLQVLPALFSQVEEIEKAIKIVAEAGLWRLYTVGGGTFIAYRRESWRKYQSYINQYKFEYDGSKYPAPPGEEWKAWADRPVVKRGATTNAETPNNTQEPEHSEEIPKNPQESPNNSIIIRPSLRPSPTPTLRPSVSEGGVEGGSADEPDAAPPPKKARQAAKHTQLPDGFEVTEQMRLWAAERVPSADIGRETERFCDHHRAKGSLYKDWTAAWRTWMARSPAFASMPRSPGMGTFEAANQPSRYARL